MKKTILTTLILAISFIGFAQYTAPYIENFDTAISPNLPQDWTGITTSPSSSITIRDNISNTAPNSAQLTSGINTSGDVILVSPRFTDLDEFKQVRFNVRRATNGGNGFSIGTLSDPNDASTFNVIESYISTFITDDWQEVIITFENHNGTDQFIGIRHDENSLLYHVLIDDFVYTDTTASTKDYSFAELKIFPIPVKEILNISNDAAINKVIIYSILGNKIKEVQPNLNNVSLNINNLPAGKYYLHIYSKDKTSRKLFFKE